MMCQDSHAFAQLSKQFCKAPILTYKLTNYKPNYPDDYDYGLLLHSDVAEAAILSKLDLYGFKFSRVSIYF